MLIATLMLWAGLGTSPTARVPAIQPMAVTIEAPELVKASVVEPPNATPRPASPAITATVANPSYHDRAVAIVEELTAKAAARGDEIYFGQSVEWYEDQFRAMDEGYAAVYPDPDPTATVDATVTP